MLTTMPFGNILVAIMRQQSIPCSISPSELLQVRWMPFDTRPYFCSFFPTYWSSRSAPPAMVVQLRWMMSHHCVASTTQTISAPWTQHVRIAFTAALYPASASLTMDWKKNASNLTWKKMLTQFMWAMRFLQQLLAALSQSISSSSIVDSHTSSSHHLEYTYWMSTTLTTNTETTATFLETAYVILDTVSAPGKMLRCLLTGGRVLTTHCLPRNVRNSQLPCSGI